MLPIVKGHITFLDSLRGSLGNTREFEETRSKHKDRVIVALRAVASKKYDLGDAAATLDCIRDSLFSESEKEELTTFIGTASFLKDVDPATEIRTTVREQLKPQEHLYIHNYLSEAEWQQLRNSSITVGTKVDVLVTKCGKIGLFSVHEKSARAICATLVVAHGQACDHSQCYDLLQIIKQGFKMLRSRRSASQKPSLSKFPASTQEFVLLAGNLFGEDPVDQPIVCPVDVNLIIQLRDSMPCRKTHNALRAPMLQLSSPQTASNRAQGGGGMHVQVLQDLIIPLTQALMNQGTLGSAIANQSTLGSTIAKPSQGAGPLLALTDGSGDSQNSAADGGSQHAGTPTPKAKLSAASSSSDSPASVAASPAAAGLSLSVLAIQNAIKDKRKRGDFEDEKEDEEEEAAGVAKEGVAGKAKGKGKGRGRGRGKPAAKAAGKAKAKAKGHAKASIKVGRRCRLCAK